MNAQKREVFSVYDSYEIATTIRMVAVHKKITLKQLLTDVGFSKNFMVNMAKGYMPVSDKLAKIADYLDVSVDYLLGRSDNPESHKNK